MAQQCRLSETQIKARSWLKLSVRGGNRKPETKPRSSSQEAEALALEAIAAWYLAQKTELEKKPNDIEPLLPWESLDCMRVPGNDKSGQKYLEGFLQRGALQLASQLCSKRAVLFWGWAAPLGSIHLYGVFLPPVQLLRHDPGLKVTQALQLHIRYESGLRYILDPQPPPYAFHGAVPLEIDKQHDSIDFEVYPDLSWLLSLPDDKAIAFAFAEMPHSMGQQQQLELRADELPQYTEQFICLHTATLAMRQLRAIAVTEGRRARERMLTGLLLSPDLTDAQARLMDMKLRLLLMLYAFLLLLQEAEARKDPDTPRFGLQLEQGEMGMAILNMLCTQHVLRQHYVYGNHELRILDALKRGGATLLAFPSHISPSDPQTPKYIASTFVAPIELATTSAKKRSTKKSSYNKSAAPLPDPFKAMPAWPMELHQHVPSRPNFKAADYTRDCDRAGGVGDSVISAHKDRFAASQHWLAAMRAGLSCSVLWDNHDNRIITATERPTRHHKTPQQDNDVPPHSAFWDHGSGVWCFERVLLNHVPVHLYGMVETDLFDPEALADAIEDAVRAAASSKDSSSVLFYQGKLWHINAANGQKEYDIAHCVASPAWPDRTFFLVPGVILAGAHALQPFLKRMQQALSLLDDDQDKKLADALLSEFNKRHELYEAGSRLYMRSNNVPYELHPSLRYLMQHVFPATSQYKAISSRYASQKKKPATVTQQQQQQQQPMAVVTEGPIYPFPNTPTTRSVAARFSAGSFLRDHAWRTAGLRLPTTMLFVPDEDMDHSCPVPGAGFIQPQQLCCYHPEHIGDLESKCTVCHKQQQQSDKPHVWPPRYRDSQGRLWRCIHYAEVPQWQFGRMLRCVREWYTQQQLTSVSALEQYLRSAGMRPIWEALKQCYAQNSRDARDTLRSNHQIACLNFNAELAAKELDENISFIIATEPKCDAPVPPEQQPVCITDTGAYKRTKIDSSLRGSTSDGSGSNSSSPTTPPTMPRLLGKYEMRELVERVKQYIGLNPKLFYTAFLGNDVYDCGDGKISWKRKNGPFCVWLKAGRVSRGSRSAQSAPGYFSDLKTGRYGDAIRYIMAYRYGTEENIKGFRAAFFYCYRWVLQTYGPGAMDLDPMQRQATPASMSSVVATAPEAPAAEQALPGITAQLKSIANKQRTEDPDTNRRIREARHYWKAAVRFQKDKSNPALEYLRNVRQIHSEHILFVQDAVRFHPCYPLSDDGQLLHYSVLLSKYVDPMAYQNYTSAEVFGIQYTALNDVDCCKAGALDVVKKGRGIIGAKYCPVHVIRPRQELSGSSAPLLFQQVRVAICEGLETAASIAEACPELDVWAAGGVGNISNYPYGVHQDVEIFYCADNDNSEVGKQRNLDRTAKLCAKGWRVHLVTPDLVEGLDKSDFNTILQHVKPREKALETIREQLLYAADVHEPTATGKLPAADEDSPSGSNMVSLG
jgi:hypothetical protein